MVKNNDRMIAMVSLFFILKLFMKIRVKTNTPHKTKMNDSMVILLLKFTLYGVKNIHNSI
jgi:hypothetical protein